MLGWGARRRSNESAEAEHVLPTKVLAKFLQAMSLQPAPVLIDLGAVVGSNVSFLGERLACKLTVEDVFADVERASREQRLPDLSATFSTRLARPDASVDGVLCWDIFDYLQKPAAAALGKELVRLVRPGGALMAFFAATKADAAPFTRFVIRDDKTLAHRHYGAAQPKRTVFTNRDVELLFPGMRVSDAFLLLSHTREVLLRK
ncbi:MAG: class I SAM-dependent methyltransferase [Vicinamibacterales bacterium]